jgi:hypothetical protein
MRQGFHTSHGTSTPTLFNPREDAPWKTGPRVIRTSDQRSNQAQEFFASLVRCQPRREGEKSSGATIAKIMQFAARLEEPAGQRTRRIVRTRLNLRPEVNIAPSRSCRAISSSKVCRSSAAPSKTRHQKVPLGDRRPERRFPHQIPHKRLSHIGEMRRSRAVLSESGPDKSNMLERRVHRAGSPHQNQKIALRRQLLRRHRFSSEMCWELLLPICIESAR